MNNEQLVMNDEQLTINKGKKPNSSPLRLFLFSFFFILFSLFIGCSSTPKKAAEVFTERNMAENQLNLANLSATRGRYQDALLIVEDARRLALISDDPSLRVRTSISRGNFLFSLGRHTEAFQEWEGASAEGDASGEKTFAALARIYAVRAKLIILANGNEASADAAVADTAGADKLRAQLDNEQNTVKSDSFSSAVCYVTMGLAEKQLRRWAEAENQLKKALAIHEKGRFLEDAAYDWFIIASIRSVAGNYNSSLEALQMAISFDRRAENGFGLASSWQAMGDVYQKAGRTEESRAARRRAAEIYRAMSHIDLAEKLEAQL